MNQMYAQVAEGKILKLNQRRGKIKGLGKLSPDSTYISRGYWPIVGTKPVIDQLTHTVSGPQYELGDEVVTRVWTVTEISIEDQELIALEKEYQEATEEHEVEAVSTYEIVLTEGTWFWNGGADSAGFIFSAISLAQALEELTVFVTDADDELRELSFESALEVAKAVGLAYRTAYFKHREVSKRLKKAKKEKV